MSEVLHRYRYVIITLSLLLFIFLLWLMLSRQETAKMPSRGVFVIETGMKGMDSCGRVGG